MANPLHTPRLLAILLGAWLLALAGSGVVVGSRVIGTLLTGTDLVAVVLLAGGIALVVGYLNYRLYEIDVIPHLITHRVVRSTRRRPAR